MAIIRERPRSVLYMGNSAKYGHLLLCYIAASSTAS